MPLNQEGGYSGAEFDDDGSEVLRRFAFWRDQHFSPFQSINYCFMPLSILQKDQKQGKWIKKAHTKQEENSLCP